MSTWHQQAAARRRYQNKEVIPLWGETTWNVVVDPPNSMMYVIVCETEEIAREQLKKFEHSYILKPQPKIGYNLKKE